MNDVKEDEVINSELFDLARSTTFSFLNKYSIFIFQIILSILLARLLTQEIWGFLILVTTFISIIALFLSFLPFSLNTVLNYAIPKYKSLDQKRNIKSIIKYSVYLKLLIIIPVYLISMLIFYLLLNIFDEILNGYSVLLFIYSPLIIFSGLESIYFGIYRGFNNFNIILIMNIIKNLLIILILLFYMIFLNDISVFLIAYTNLACFTFTFFLNSLILLIKYRKISLNNKDYDNRIKFKTYFQDVSKYGRNIGVSIMIDEVWKQLEVTSIGIFQTASLVTGYSIASYYKDLGQSASASFTYPLLTSFSKINSRKIFKRITIFYKLIFKYSLHLSLFITGIMIFSARFVLLLVYGTTYIIFLPLISLYIFFILFTGLNSSFDAYLMLEKNTKDIIPFRALFVLIRACLFLLFLIIFNLFYAILGIIIANFIIFCLQVIFSIKKFRIRINLLSTFKQYIIFIMAFALSLLFHELILNDMNIIVLEALNLDYLSPLPLITILFFIFFFFGFSKFLKIFSIKEIDLMKALFSKKNFVHRTMRSIFNLLK